MQESQGDVKKVESSVDVKKVKTKEQYSRNVKKLKVKLKNVENEIRRLQDNSNEDSKILQVKKYISVLKQYCIGFTPQMLFRFADKTSKGTVSNSQLIETLSQIGLKLSKDQILRLQYLIDENLSGDVSFSQFNAFLNAFSIKKQFNPNDLLVKDAFKKIDLNTIIENVDQNNRNKKKKQLLNYQEFLKYCHRHFAGLKDVELASIFNKLSRDGYIDLQDLIDYLRSLEDQKIRIAQKNKKRNKNKESNQPEEIASLKHLLISLFRNRASKAVGSLVFHSAEFSRLQKLLHRKRGLLLNLFKEIDRDKKGSFDFKELIRYFISKQEQNKNKDLIFVFQLIGKRYTTVKEKPQSAINQYNRGLDIITEIELKKYFQNQFEIKEPEVTTLISLIPKENENIFKVSAIINLMNLQGNNRKLVFIRPNLLNTHNNLFVNKKTVLMTYNGIYALRFCLSIVEQMAAAKQSLWNDFQFGPLDDDELGLECIEISMPNDQIQWKRVDALGMVEFYKAKCTQESKYSSSSICPNDIFCKSLFNLIEIKEDLLWNQQKIDPNVKDILEQHLKPLFSGVYPRVFHSFAKYGIYVFKFYQEEKWVYVIIDNKIPCNLESEPYFSHVKNKRYSWISLLEKAYAKLKGSYKEMYQVINSSKIYLEISGKLAVQSKIVNETLQEKKNEFWQNLIQNYQKRQKTLYCLSKQDGKGNLTRQKIDTGICCSYALPIQGFIEIKDQKSQNKHKSHRLVVIQADSIQNQKRWNCSWSRGEESNKYDAFQKQIQEDFMKKYKSSIQQNNNFLLLNYKLFRSIFDTMLEIKEISFENMIILRKRLEFEQNHRCRYELSSKQNCTLIIILRRIEASTDSKIAMEIKNQNEEPISTNILKADSNCFQILIPKNKPIQVEFFITNWLQKQNYFYNLTFYFEHPRYSLHERDRHLLFRYVSQYEEEAQFFFKNFGETEKKYIFTNFYMAADQKKAGCCG